MEKTKRSPIGHIGSFFFRFQLIVIWAIKSEVKLMMMIIIIIIIIIITMITSALSIDILLILLSFRCLINVAIHFLIRDIHDRLPYIENTQYCTIQTHYSG